MLGAELAVAYTLHCTIHRYAPFTLMTTYLMLTLIGNGHQLNCHMETSMIENGRLGPAKVENKL